jgi:hypothetical protein
MLLVLLALPPAEVEQVAQAAVKQGRWVMWQVAGRSPLPLSELLAVLTLNALVACPETTDLPGRLLQSGLCEQEVPVLMAVYAVAHQPLPGYPLLDRLQHALALVQAAVLQEVPQCRRHGWQYQGALASAAALQVARHPHSKLLQ